MKNIFLPPILFFSFALCSCAKPNYKKPDDPAPQSAKPDVPDSPTAPSCELFMKQQHLCVSFAWTKTPDSQNLGGFDFKFYVQEKPETFVTPSGGDVSVMLWMPSMGHGSSPVKVEKVRDGEYKASEVFFIMPGAWEIHIQIKKDKDVVEEVVKKFNM